MLPTIVVDNKGTELAYIDSGPPYSGGVYTTIFAVHGILYTSPIFKKVSAICHTKGVRFVAINRRGYSGSTPFSDADKLVLNNGTPETKTEWLKARGFEIATFIDTFIQRENLPPVSAEGNRGGAALLGWSAGGLFTAATIAHVPALPPPVQARLASYLRVHIMEEPPSITFGLPMPPQTYSPELDTFIPERSRLRAMIIWLTSYFQHGDLSTRDINIIEYVVPAASRPPSIYNMSAKEMTEIIEEGPYSAIDTPLALNCMPQSHVVYEKANFDKSIKARLPNLKIWVLVGDATASFPLATLWTIQDDDKAHGGNNINFKILPGVNHFMHWDDPEKTVEAYLEALS